MIIHDVRSYRLAEPLAREDQLAWRLASVATNPVPVDPDVAEMIGNRIIDNAAVAAADGTVIQDELVIADAHPLDARPFNRPEYVEKFRTLADGIVAPEEQDRFLALVARLPELSAVEVGQLGFTVAADKLGPEAPAGIF